MTTTIVIADDHRMMRDGLRSMLIQTEGIEIVGEAENGREAVDLAKSLKPDIIILDIEMPGLNGIDAARQIGKVTDATKVIALSIHKEPRFVTGMLTAGAAGYVLKASAFDELSVAIEAVKSGNPYISPKVTGVILDDYLKKLAQPAKQAQRRDLTPREREVVQLLTEGHSVREAAEILHVSLNTVDTHRKRVMEKLDIHSVAELTKYAISEGITSLD